LLARSFFGGQGIKRGAGLRIRSGSAGSLLVQVAALALPSSIEALEPLPRLCVRIANFMSMLECRHAQGHAMLLVVRRRFPQLGVRDDVMLNPQPCALLLEPGLDFGF